MKSLYIILVFLIFLVYAAAETNIYDVTASQTWTTAGSPYIINGTVFVYNNATITIDAGVQVRFNAGAAMRLGNYSGGNIVANGIEENPVLFTANTDTPSPGFWDYILTTGWCWDTVFNHCVFEYGGANYGHIYVEGGDPEFNHCEFRHSPNYGLFHDLWGSSATRVSNCTFTDNVKTVSLPAQRIESLSVGNVYTGNTDNRIYCPGGNISTSTVWTAQSTPIYFPAGMNGGYGSAPTIVIPNGSILEFAAGTRWYMANGDVLQATGATFRGEQSTPGFWRGLYFYYNSGNSLISGCTIRDAGYDNQSAIQFDCPQSIVTGSLITNCASTGIWMDLTSLVSISGNTITGCGSYPLSLSDNSVRVLGEGNDFNGNTLDMVEVRIWNIQASGVWRNPGVPYYLNGNLTISGSTPFPHIEIQSGTVIMLPHNGNIYIGSIYGFSQGSLEAKGVTFTRVSSSAQPKGLYFNYYADYQQCVFNQCIFEYSSGDNLGAVYVDGNGPTFERCTFRNNPNHGIVGGYSGKFTNYNCSFINNGGYPVQLYSRNYDSYVGTGCTYSGNNPNRILIMSNSMDESKTYVWNHPGIPLEIASTITISGYLPTPPVLKLNSGLILLFRNGSGLNIGSSNGNYPGGIEADGATLSALTGTTGGWNGLLVDYALTSNSYLRNCVIEYAGSNGNVYIPYSTLPVVESCVIRYGELGINIANNYGTTNIIRNYLLDNTTGIYCFSNANPLIGGSLADANCISGNTSYGVYNATPSLTVNAEYNWWGNQSGPFHATNPDGLGDAVSNYVDFDPWRSTNIGDSPSRFHLLLPAFGAELQTLAPFLDWEEAIDPTPGDVITYTVELALNSTFTSGLITYSGLASSFLQIPASTLSDDTRYYWRVKATDTQEQTTNCFETDFYFDTAVPEAPLPFDPISPAYYSTVDLTSNLLIWEEAIDPDAGDFITYTVYQDITAGFENAAEFTTTNTSVLSGFCAPGSLCYWKVKATDLTGNATFSPTWRFFVDWDARPRPPVDFTITPSGLDLLVEWDLVPGADTYDIYYSLTPLDGFSLLQSGLNSPQYLHLGAAQSAMGYYFVVANDTN